MKLADFIFRGLKRDLADYESAVSIIRTEFGIRVTLKRKVKPWVWREIHKICISWRLQQVNNSTWEAVIPETDVKLSDLAV